MDFRQDHQNSGGPFGKNSPLNDPKIAQMLLAGSIAAEVKKRKEAKQAGEYVAPSFFYDNFTQGKSNPYPSASSAQRPASPRPTPSAKPAASRTRPTPPEPRVYRIDPNDPDVIARRERSKRAWKIVGILSVGFVLTITLGSMFASSSLFFAMLALTVIVVLSAKRV